MTVAIIDPTAAPRRRSVARRL